MIYIDVNEANVVQPVGSNVFVQELIKALDKTWDKNLPPVRLLLSQPPVTDFFNQLKFPLEVIPPTFFWTQWRLPMYLFKHKPKIIFTPGHYAPRFKPKQVKSIITIFDLAYLRFPDQFLTKDLWQLKNWTAYSVKQADIILTISESSRSDIISAYHQRADKIKVVYPGHRFKDIKPQPDLCTQLINKHNLKPKQFLLFVGTLQPRKNVTALIEAFMSITKDLPDYKLVLTGRPGWLFDDSIKPTLKRAVIKSKGRVIWLKFVTDLELACLYYQAKYLVLPSLWEGFGLPVVEAGAFKTPAIVSQVSSLTEIVKDQDLLIKPPFNAHAISQALMRMIKLNRSDYNNKQKQAYLISRRFSWLKAAKYVKKQLIDLYQS